LTFFKENSFNIIFGFQEQLGTHMMVSNELVYIFLKEKYKPIHLKPLFHAPF